MSSYLPSSKSTRDILVEHDATSGAAEIERIYDALLDREAAPDDLAFWSNALATGTPVSAFVNAILSSSEFAQRHPEPLTHEKFVELIYVNALGRDPLVAGQDTQGFRFWVDVLDQGNAPSGVVTGIADSAEHLSIEQPLLSAGLPIFSEKAAAVARLYHALLERDPDEAGLTFWTQALESGTSIGQIAADFLATREYHDRHPTQTAGSFSDPAYAGAFVDAIYQDALGRAADPDGRKFWVDALLGGANPADIAVGIAEGPEAVAHLARDLADDYGQHLAAAYGASVTVSPASGDEDTAIALAISASSTTGDPLSIDISGVTGGATLNHGTQGPPGTWHLSVAELSGLTYMPAADASGSFQLLVTATSSGSNPGSASQPLTVSVAPVSDTPTVGVTATAAGPVGAPVPLAISAAQGDTDGSETVTVSIAGVPTGATLNHGSVNPDGSWTVAASDLPGLTITPPSGSSADFTLTVTALAKDGAAAPAASTSATIAVTVVGAPVFTLGTASGVSTDSAINLGLTIGLAAGDAGEVLSDVQIFNVPSSYTLTRGLRSDDTGVWIVPAAQLGAVQLVPSDPSAFGSFSIRIAAGATDPASGLTVTREVTQGVTITAPVGVIERQVIDGYVSGATVFADTDSDGVLDPGEVSTTTRADGTFTLVGAPAGARLVMFGGTDISTGQAFQGKLTALADSTVITPLTTLVETIVSKSSGSTTAAQAEAAVKTALGIDDSASPISLSTFDPIGATASGSANLSAVGAAVLSAGIQVQATVTQVAAANGATTSTDVVAALATQITTASGTASPTVDLKSAATIQAVAVGAGVPPDAANAVSTVTADANKSVADAVTSANGDATAILSNVSQAANVALGSTTDAIATTNFSDPVQTQNLKDNNTGAALDTKIDSAPVGVVTAPIVGTIGTDNLVGTSGDDAIDGQDGDDMLSGAAGNDQLFGGAGKDALTGDAGNDLLDGGAGLDRAIYSAATAGITVNLAAGTVVGDASVGTDTLRSVETVRGTGFADTYTAAGFAKVATDAAPNAGGDQGTFNEFEGLGGNDTITGNGNTRVSYLTATAAVTVTLGAGGGAVSTAPNDAAGIGTDTFVSGVNQVRGSAFADRLVGSNTGGGDPRIFEGYEGLGGNDTIDGGGGIDRVRYDNFSTGTAGISVNMAAGTVTGLDAGATSVVGADTLISVESVIGSSRNDIYDASGYTATTNLSAGQTVNDQGTFNEFEGVGGDDTITGNGNTRVSYIRANAGVTVQLGPNGSGTGHGIDIDAAGVGSDTFVSGVYAVRGSNFGDVLRGSNTNGNTTEAFDGRGGDDTIDGGAGFDRARYDLDVNTTTGVSIKLANGALGYAIVTGRDAATTAVIGTDHLVSIEGYIGTYSDDVYDATGYTATTNLSAGQTTNDQGTFNEFEGVGGNDTVTGNGNTRVTYQRAQAGVTVTLDAAGGGTAHGSDAGDVANIGNDTFVSGVTAVRGSNFADTLTGSAAGQANVTEIWDGGAGDDTIDGGGGNDLVRYDSFTAGPIGIQVNLAAGTVTSSDATTLASYGTDTLRHVEQIRGTSGVDTFDATGFGAASTNAGSNGFANFFEGRGGNDTVIGNNFTTLGFATAAAGVVVNFVTGKAYGTDASDSAQIGQDTFSGIGQIVGSNFADTVLTNVLSGNFQLGAGLDTVTLAAASGGTYNLVLNSVETLNTIAAADETVSFTTPMQTPIAIDLGSGTDSVSLGSATAIWILNLANVETLFAGANNQTVSLQSTTPGLTVDLGAGTDTLNMFGTGATPLDFTVSVRNVENINAGNGNDTITFDPNGQLGQTFNLGGGTNVIQLAGSSSTFAFSMIGFADNSIIGRAGADDLTLNGTVSGVTIDLGAGTDALHLTGVAGLFNDVTVRNVETVYGSAQGDGIKILAGTGITTVIGGGGGDTYTASTAEDHFRFTAMSDSPNNGSVDLVNGFQAGSGAGHDVFEFSSAILAGQHLDYIDANAFSAGSGHAQAHLVGNNLEIDTNADQQADMLIQLVNLAGTLNQSDFFVV